MGAIVSLSLAGFNSSAKEINALPSAGIDFFFSNSATSLKDIKEEVKSEAAAKKEQAAEKSADPTATAQSTPDVIEVVVETIPEEEKVIEETTISTTEKTTKEVEHEIEERQEEEGFKNLVIAKVNDYVHVRKEPSTDADIIGKLYDKSAGEFIEEENGWYKIQSGSVTGYVKAEYCVTGEDAIELAKKVGTRVATVDTTTLKVREEPSTEAVTLGLVPMGEVLTVSEELEGWVKVNIEEGDGYVSRDYVKLSTEFVQAESKEEEEARLAKERKEREAAIAAANKARQKSNNKTSNGNKNNNTQQQVYATGGGSELGNAVANYALQFNGNPYVYGGTSLTNGADCSGFVLSVYKHFGVNLPHSANADRNQGYAVDGIANAQPGDLMCYSGHVGIYIGGGQIIHASTAKTGIKISSATYRPILAIRRIF